MPNPARAAAERIAQELLSVLVDLGAPLSLRVTGANGHLACLIQVWTATRVMPTAAAERRRVPTERAGCRADVLEVIRVAGKPVTTKEVVRALKAAGRTHGPGTVTKALAELTRQGELENPRDGRGYRVKGWREPGPPSLF